MGFRLFKKKPSEVAGLIFAHIIAFIDGLSLPRVRSLSLAETYLLAEWIQIASVISAVGGYNGRVRKIIRCVAGEQFDRLLGYLVVTGRLKKADLTEFREYILEMSTSRRQQYDAAFQKEGSMRDVAVTAFPCIVVEAPTGENLIEDVKVLQVQIEQIIAYSIKSLKAVV